MTRNHFNEQLHFKIKKKKNNPFEADQRNNIYFIVNCIKMHNLGVKGKPQDPLEIVLKRNLSKNVNGDLPRHKVVLLLQNVRVKRFVIKLKLFQHRCYGILSASQPMKCSEAWHSSSSGSSLQFAASVHFLSCSTTLFFLLALLFIGDTLAIRHSACATFRNAVHTLNPEF